MSGTDICTKCKAPMDYRRSNDERGTWCEKCTVKEIDFWKNLPFVKSQPFVSQVTPNDE